MSDITLGYIFVPTDGTNRLTSMKLNRLGRGAVINPSFVSSKPAVSGASAGDQFIMLKADGTYARVPATAFGGGGGGGGDMFKAVYDTNGNGVVDTCDALPWTAVTGKPTVFPPDSTAELVAHKGVANGYAALDATGKVPVAELPAFGTGDMTKAVYDTNGNNVVDTCDSLAWAKLTGVPATFPPDSTAMLKSVYDTNNDGISDHAALADTAPWTGISGKPASFSPSAHGSTHLDNGSDPVPVATTLRTGSLRILSGSATQYLDGSGNWSTPAPAGTVNPGTYTAFSYQTNWSENSTARYRVETNGTFQKIVFKGSIKKAATFTTNLAIILPAGARPSDTRRFQLAGQETNTSPDECLYTGVVDTSGNFNIYPVVRSSFVWQVWANLQTIWLDNVSFEL